MKKMGCVVALILVCTLAFVAIAFAAGTEYTKEIIANYVGVQLVVNGNAVTPKDANGNTVEPFIVDGTTYLPVRTVAEVLGQTVEWDGTTKTVYIGEHLASSTANPPAPTIQQQSPIGLDGRLHTGNIDCFNIQAGGENFYITFQGNLGWQGALPYDGSLPNGCRYIPLTDVVFPDTATGLFFEPYTTDLYVSTNIYNVENFSLSDPLMRMIAILTQTYVKVPTDSTLSDGEIILPVWSESDNENHSGTVCIGLKGEANNVFGRWIVNEVPETKPHIGGYKKVLSIRYEFKDKTITIPFDVTVANGYDDPPYNYELGRPYEVGDCFTIDGIRCIYAGSNGEILFNLNDLIAFLGDDCPYSSVSTLDINGVETTYPYDYNIELLVLN